MRTRSWARAESLLNSIGLNGLIAFTHEEYEKKAIDLYNDPVKLKKFREELGQAKVEKRLFNTGVFCREFESALAQLFATH